MEYKNISKKSILEWIILRSILVIITLITALLATGLLINYYDDMVNEIGKISTVIIDIVVYFYVYATLVITLIYAYIFPRIQYSNYKYKITDKMIEIKRGVVFKKTEYVPFVRMQHIEVFRGITDRMFKMSTIIIFTAGSSARITNIQMDEADILIEDLKKLVSNLKAEYDNE